MLKRMFSLKSILLIFIIQWALYSSVFSSPWEGHYQGTMEGWGRPLVRNVEGTWDMVVTPEGDYRLYMEIPTVMSSVLSMGTVDDNGSGSGTFIYPFGEETLTVVEIIEQTPEGPQFQVTISGGMTGTMTWTLSADGNVEGEWVFDSMPVMGIDWNGSGTLTGDKIVPNPNQGYYAGIYYGPGGPGPIAGVNGDWMMSVKDDGSVTFVQTNIPIIDQIVFTGKIESDGSFVMNSDVPVAGETTCSGTFTDNHLHGDFVGGLTGSMDQDVNEDGSIIGTWGFTINIPFTPWTGSGVVEGNTLN